MADERETDDRTADTAHPSHSARRCSNCGAHIEPTDWYPLVGYTDADGTYHIEPFCGDDCRREWLADRPDLRSG